jgi:hypothetical protein
MMSVTTIYPVLTMHGKHSGLRALLWHFNGYYDSPDIYYSLVTTMSVTMIYPVITMPGKYPGLRALLWTSTVTTTVRIYR